MESNVISNKHVWVIMSKDRALIAKGTPRNRSLVRTDDTKDKKRLLTYASRGKAESAFKTSGFYDSPWGWGADLTQHLEAVEVSMKIEIV